ncbi:hypothetical protein [Jannaschia pohangensis]|uniref:Lipoprotein n=1 Tax=Jannaschia pohangensis TaxID=390807 RepID=A0A1I3JBT8_9RHOB|nr:hypothetical protein [Jannaschia pohangensis]SFI57721.1 hypothetical protein SAMN04488095_1276 [Jannaschia pohangensis]
MFRLILPLSMVLAGCNASVGPVGVSIGGPEASPAVANPADYKELDHNVPRGVEAALPPGVSKLDVRENDLCYAYVQDGLILPVKRPDGSQYCLK